MRDRDIIKTEDQQLISLVRSGDRLAFTELYHRYKDRMLALAFRKLGNFSDAEEIVQDIFLDLWNRRELVDINNNVGSYLCVSVKYRVINAQNRMFRTKNFQNELVYLLWETPGTRPCPNSSRELESEIDHLIKKLPNKCRTVYTLSRVRGYSKKEILQIMRISEKTFESHLTKALNMLRENLS